MPTKVIASKPAAESADFQALRDGFASATNDEIDAYIDANVRDLASARAFLKRLTRIVRTLARRAK